MILPDLYNFKKISFLIKKNISENFLIVLCILFIIYYILNINSLNFFSTDFQVRYKPNGINLFEKIFNLKLSEIDIFNFYFIPELLTGLFLKISPDLNTFSILLNIFNIIILFFSFNFFFRSLDKSKDNVLIITFLLIFFSYIGNWIWCFWKLADIYFLFIFSLVFYFTNIGIKKNKKKYILYAFLFSLISLITKPQGIAVFAFYLVILIFFYQRKINFLKLLFIFIVIYILCFPLITYFFIKLNLLNNITHFMYEGYITGTIFYKYDDFLNNFSLSKNELNNIFYYYYLFIKKIIYQLTFLRETYSIKHNIFLLFYIIVIFASIIINLNNLYDDEKLFFNTTLLISVFSILMHSSLNTADEPNRHQLFNLTPIYILSAMSFAKTVTFSKNWIKKFFFKN